MAGIDRDTLLDIYTRTMKVGRTDEKFRELLMQGKVAVMYYCVRGQELVSAAAMAALEDDDYVVCTYRGQGEQTAKGIPMEKWWGECLGKATGTCKGKGGTMHITDPDTGIMVTTGVVGSGIPIANGLAMASQNSGDGRVTVASFGDGAANIGGFHEAMNGQAANPAPTAPTAPVPASSRIRRPLSGWTSTDASDCLSDMNW